MVTILVLTAEKDREFEDAFAEYLVKGFEGAGDLTRMPNSSPLTLRSIWDTTEPVSGRTILIYNEIWPEPLPLTQPEQAIAIVNSANEALLEQVSATGLTAISCGLHSRDTITLSSMSEDSAVIDLRRVVTGFDGAVIEPQEIPVRLQCIPNQFALMSAAAVMLLTSGYRSQKEKCDDGV